MRNDENTLPRDIMTKFLKQWFQDVFGQVENRFFPGRSALCRVVCV
jgi:hypothetical protein